MRMWLQRLALVVALVAAAPSLHVEPSPLQPNHAIAQAAAYDEGVDSPDALLGSLLYANGLADYSDSPPLPEGAYENLRHTMSTCSWTSTPVVAEVLYGENVAELYAGSPNYTSYVTPPPVTACKAPDSLGGTWIAQRVGPFETRGGYTWHDLTVKTWPDLTAVMNERDETWIVGGTTFSTRADGSVLIYPPIHMHHSRIEMQRMWARTAGDTLTQHHQDKVCGSLKGTSQTRSAGYDCMYTRFPDGYGALMDGRMLEFTAAFNDIRDAGSSTLSWYVEYAVSVAPLDSVKRRAVYVWQTAHYGVDNEMRFYAFPKLTAQAAITWVHAVPTISGEVMAIWMHSHENLGHNQTWIFNAAPTELGLNAAPYTLPVCANFVPDEKNITVDDFKWHVLQSAVSSGASLRCVARTRHDISPHLGDEQPTWECAAGAGDRIVAGQNLTSVTFFDGMAGDEELSPQHIHWQMYLWDPAGSTRTFTRTWDPQEDDGITLTDRARAKALDGECSDDWMTGSLANGGTEPDTEVS